MPANNRSAVSGGLNLSLESLGVNLPYSMEAEQAVLGAAILDAVKGTVSIRALSRMRRNIRKSCAFALCCLTAGPQRCLYP